VDHANLSAQTISRDELKDIVDIVEDDNGTFVVKEPEEADDEEELLDTGTFVMKDWGSIHDYQSSLYLRFIL